MFLALRRKTTVQILILILTDLVKKDLKGTHGSICKIDRNYTLRKGFANRSRA